MPKLRFNKIYIEGFMKVLRSKFHPSKDYYIIGLYTIERDEGYVATLIKGELFHFHFCEEDVVDEWVKEVLSGDRKPEKREVSLESLDLVL